MSIRGSITLECDSPKCHGELVLEAVDFADTLSSFTKGAGVQIELCAAGWMLDDNGDLHCPACCEEHERDPDEDDGRTYGHPGDRLAGRE